MNGNAIGWTGIVRLGLIQAGIGAIVVLATSTMNRIMVVELALPAVLPGLLVALHYVFQLLRPRMGYGSDVGGRRVPWIIGGIAVLAIGGVGAAAATALMASRPMLGIAAAIVAYAVIGAGVSAAGTTLLVLLAQRVAPARRAAAATIVWLMMIAGIGVTATVVGRLLDPYSPFRLIQVTAEVAGMVVVLSLLAVWGIEGRSSDRQRAVTSVKKDAEAGFMEALRQVWTEPQARNFAIFVFVAMLAYSAQELILEPFAGAVFGLTPGQSTGLTGMQHGGVLLGMAVVAVAGANLPGRLGSLRLWTIGGCAASSIVLLALAIGGFAGPSWPLRPIVFALGVANGAFAVSAIGSMMQLAHSGRASREGVRMGLWGAAQALAFACGGLISTTASDIAHRLLGSPVTAYAAVFVGEAVLFLLAAGQAARVFGAASRDTGEQSSSPLRDAMPEPMSEAMPEPRGA
ncbi:MAG: BCD family MFS transporter [Alphaproteobacteria bacterium]|nr:BCD family MFS transporter [Alphaproteobacteria bacterium]